MKKQSIEFYVKILVFSSVFSFFLFTSPPFLPIFQNYSTRGVAFQWYFLSFYCYFLPTVFFDLYKLTARQTGFFRGKRHIMTFDRFVNRGRNLRIFTCHNIVQFVDHTVIAAAVSFQIVGKIGNLPNRIRTAVVFQRNRAV